MRNLYRRLVRREKAAVRAPGRIAAAGFPAAAARGYSAHMSLTILLIDTEEARARALEEKLSESGFARVLRARGHDLAAIVETERPDLVIIDMALPDRDAL